MVMQATPAYVSAKTLTCPLSPATRAQRKLPRASCALSPPKWRESRRLISISLVLSHLLSIPDYAIAGSIFDKYVKSAEKSLEAEQPQYATCRSLLRSGPAASLRANIRAVAQYALDNGNGNTASDSVDQCLRALEELDSLLLRASRNDPEASVESMKGKINTALNALDSLLQTIPSDVLQKGKAVADSYMIKEDEPEILDQEMQRLESIL